MSAARIVFAVNRDLAQPLPLSLDLRAFPGLRVAEWWVLDGPDLKATNTEAQPDRVTPRRRAVRARSAGPLKVTLPPASWNVLRLVPVATPGARTQRT